MPRKFSISTVAGSKWNLELDKAFKPVSGGCKPPSGMGSWYCAGGGVVVSLTLVTAMTVDSSLSGLEQTIASCLYGRLELIEVFQVFGDTLLNALGASDVGLQIPLGLAC